MNASEIYEKVTTSADRFGARNPQQLAFLRSVLGKCEQQQLAKALTDLFAQENAFERQALGGLLLMALRPAYAADLRGLILSVLDHWDRSVGQLPCYLAFLHGADRCRECLAAVLDTEHEEARRQKLETMLWWIRNQHD